MSISILNRGASGGLKPELVVTAPSGSKIDILQNNAVVATYTLGSSETKHTFTVKVGTYTVRGTLDGMTKSEEVLIDTVGQYAVEIIYVEYLYNYGEQNYEWSARAWKASTAANNNSSTPSVTINADGSASVAITSSGYTYSAGVYELVNDFDLTDYKTLTLTFNYSFSTSYTKDSYCSKPYSYLAVVPRSSAAWQDSAVASIGWNTSGNNQTVELDVSSISGLYDVIIGIYDGGKRGNSGTRTVTVKTLLAA